MKIKKATIALLKISKKFRILNKWQFRYIHDKTISGQIVINTKKKMGFLYKWHDNTPTPKKYILHEVLHCVLRALLTMDKRKSKELRETEEQLVQDICKLIKE